MASGQRRCALRGDDSTYTYMCDDDSMSDDAEGSTLCDGSTLTSNHKWVVHRSAHDVE